MLKKPSLLVNHCCVLARQPPRRVRITELRPTFGPSTPSHGASTTRRTHLDGSPRPEASNARRRQRRRRRRCGGSDGGDGDDADDGADGSDDGGDGDGGDDDDKDDGDGGGDGSQVRVGTCAPPPFLESRARLLGTSENSGGPIY